MKRALLVALVLLSPIPAGSAAAPVREEDGPAALQDSVALPLESGTIIRQGEQPAIDVRSDPTVEQVSLRTDVLFEFGSATLTPEAAGVLDAAVEQIRALGPSSLVITGHTDSVGDDESNQVLSEQRAAAVDQGLRDRLGEDSPASDVSGRGEAEPLAANEAPDGSDNPAGRALNRRVQIEVVS